MNWTKRIRQWKAALKEERRKVGRIPLLTMVRLKITESRVLGQQPLCENDTNGDGDCHLCARKGGCFWPNPRDEPRGPNADNPSP